MKHRPKEFRLKTPEEFSLEEIENEVRLINKKKSNRSRSQREKILKIWDSGNIK